jgi:hypothetical protein
MTFRPLKSVLLTSLALASFAGCGGEMQEPSAEESLNMNTTQESLKVDTTQRTFTNGDSDYVFVKTPKRWKEAQEWCQRFSPGFNLATINDSREEDFLARQQQGYPKSAWWLGHNDQESENQFTSVGDSLGEYVNWAGSEPNDKVNPDVENCVVDNWDRDGRWNDYPCDGEQPFICEYKLLKRPLRPIATQYGRYVFVKTPMDWPQAKAWCQKELGSAYDLVVINDSQEEDLLHQQQKTLPKSAWWIGHNDQENEGLFALVGGVSSGYENWAGGEPNDTFNPDDEDCAVDNWDRDGRWNDYPCYRQQPFICERN